MHSAPPALRSSRTGGLDPDPYPRGFRPTVVLAAIYVSVWLLGPLVELLAMVFGGKSPGDIAADPSALLNDQAALADYFFGERAYMIVVILTLITVARWWRVIQFESAPLRPRAFVIVPWAFTAVVSLAAILIIAATPDLSASLLAMQLIAMLGVVFVEEIGWRGVALVGLRGSGFPEWSVWLITSAGFALMHLLNLVVGADLTGTLFQVGYTFLLGTACYLGRRAGGLWLAFAVHFANNFAQIMTGADPDSPLYGIANILGLVAQLPLLLSLPATIILVVEARRARREALPAAPAQV